MSGSEETYDRRRSPRVEAKLDVAYEDHERQVFLSVADLSLQGARVLDAEPPPEGASARLVLELPGGQLLRIDGEVTRHHDDPPGFAFRFDQSALSSADREVLEGFLESSKALWSFSS